MLRDSFIPTREQRELREATRYRNSIIQERTIAINRLQKMLEGANIKIGTILNSVQGVTCRNLIEYVLENDEEITLEKANELVVTKIHAKLEDVVRAMDGIVTPFQKTLMKEVIKHIDEITERIAMRRGKKRAITAVAHSILIAIYYMIKEDKEYKDLGANFYNQFNTEKKANAYIKKLKELGYDIQINAQVN